MALSILDEFEGLHTGDARLDRRALGMVAKMGAHPDMPYPQLFDEAELQGTYRFFAHDELTSAQLLEPHYAATKRRASAHEVVLALHDSTNVTHGRAGPGRDFYALGNGIHGYVAHVSLLATPDRLPLGVGNLRCLERGPKGADNVARPKESTKWLDAVEASAERFEGVSLVHVMDSEASLYELLAPLLEQGHRFVLRGDARNVAVHTGRRWEQRSLLDELRQSAVLGERQVELSLRTASDPHSKRNRSRAARTATLTLRAARVCLPRPRNLRGTGEHGQPVRIELNVVLVEEEHPPEGQEPVRWVLLTSEPIDTLEQVSWVVDAYRARWLIEEFFKALKTGCAFERRGFEYQHTSQNALALTLPIAYQLLLLRALERLAPSAPASELLGPALPVLRAIAKRRLPPRPTVAHALAAIAALGGHKKSNGQVGWLVLARGMNQLRQAVHTAIQLREAALRGEELEM